MPYVLAVSQGLVGSQVRGGGRGAAPALPSPHFAPTLAGEHEWKIVSTGIADCYFNVTELPPGSTAKFRVACVNKAGQGPYSTPSGKVHLEVAGEQILSCRAWGSRGDGCGAAASGMFQGSLSLWESSLRCFGEPLAPHSWLIPPFAPHRCPSCPSQGHRCPRPREGGFQSVHPDARGAAGAASCGSSPHHTTPQAQGSGAEGR